MAKRSIALVSDIHGNLETLFSIWHKMRRLDLTEGLILNAGDSVAYGDRNSECIDFIRSHANIVSVGGNYDYNVAEYADNPHKYVRKWSVSRPEKLLAIKNASDEISNEQRGWLKGLPKQLELDVMGKSVFLCHYSPLGKKTGLGSWTGDDELFDIAESCNYDVVVIGHTHTPFVRTAGSTLFINPGSIGRSWTEPTFAVMTIDGDLVTGEIRQ